MRFRKISFHNFGLLAGDQTLDLSTTSEGEGGVSIVLIGGQNGAGKTTILEALRLCLYGRLAFGPRVSTNDYHGHLLARIHRPKGNAPAVDGAAITLEFELNSNGKVDLYQIQRSWARKGAQKTTVSEDFTVFKNGGILSDLDSEYWQDFVQSLIPAGVSQLFFFDGEQIQKLAEDDVDNQALAESVKALLGLEVIERLQSDLAIYVNRESKKSGSQLLDGKTQELATRIKHLKGEIEEISEERKTITKSVETLEDEVQRCEQGLMQSGKGFYDNRDKNKKRQIQLETKITQLEKQLQELCEQELPFALSHGLSLTVRKQLQSEADLLQWEASQTYVQAFAQSLVESLGGTAARKEAGLFDSLIQATLERSLQRPAELQEVTVLHGVSGAERAQMDGWIDKAVNTLPTSVHELVGQLERNQRDLQRIQKALSHVPEQDVLKPLMETLFGVQKRIAELKAQDEWLASQQAEKERALALVERDNARLNAHSQSAGEQAARLRYAEKTLVVLKSFNSQLTANRLQRLEKVFVDTFNFLSRKITLSAVRIHADTFQTDMFDDEGNSLDKKQFSAGEKQIYAVAMLWSLAKLSGRPLPVVIDTPLGRLDSVHRAKLLAHYFPNASHQVIILSTDTEVERHYFEQLRPYLARTYLLKHDPSEGRTRAEVGYFWKEEAVV